jgi:protein-tyrosine-phosphatase
MLIHFICRGNVLRSLVAETYLNSLQLPDIKAISSGTNVDFSIPSEREYFKNTQDLLERHGILRFAKSLPDQLTEERAANSDSIVILNQRAYEEATQLIDLPKETIVWSVVDIGEGDRIATENNRHDLEEIIYKEITANVDVLLAEQGVSKFTRTKK